MEFLIGFDPGNTPIHISGGMLIIKKLVEMLTEKNQTVYVLNHQYKTEKAHLISFLEFSKLDKNKLVVIYPEIISGNPFQAKNVVRWILYDTNNRIENSWQLTDEYFYFNNLFKTNRIENNKKILNCFYFQLDKLYDMNLTRDGYCHIDKHPRGVLPENLVKEYNSEEISKGFNQHGYDWLRRKLNEKKYFITNDPVTYYSTMAALCGCVSVIIDRKMTKEERENSIVHKYGVAFGFDEIEQAKNDLPLLRPYLQDYDLKSNLSVDNFINFWKNKLG